MALSNWLKDSQLKDLVKQYFKSEERQADPWRDTLRSAVETAQRELLNGEALDALSDENLIESALSVYRAVVRVPMYYKAITNHPAQVRAALHYLAESKDDVAAKADAVIGREGEHNVGGLGKTFWSVFLMALDPGKNPYWTGKTVEGLNGLGMLDVKPSDTPGQVYREIAKAELALAGLHEKADLYEIDHFMHFIVVLEGREILDEWRGVSGEAAPAEDEWVGRIAAWRAEYVPAERIAVRKEGESEARDVLEGNLGHFDRDTLARFFELVNADYYGGQPHRDRFRPAFMGAYENRIAEQINLFNDWSGRLWMADDAEVYELLDTFWEQKAIAYARTSLPTLVLYLRDPLTYSMWLDPMRRGVERMGGPGVGRDTGANYRRYNEAVAELRARYGLQPQELDVILFLAGEKAEEISEVAVDLGPRAFQGFVPDTFAFLAEIEKNNRSEWMEKNKERYQSVLREPLRALFVDVGPAVAQLDPNLETEAKFGKVMATVKKRWPDAEGPYHPYLWGAFYRADRTKQTDAQMFVIVHPEGLWVGIGAGKGASDALERFRQNVRDYPELFWRLISPLQSKGVEVTTKEAHGETERVVESMNSADDVAGLADLGHIDIEFGFAADDPRLLQPAFADEVSSLFAELYPLYLFFVSDSVEESVGPVLEEGVAEEMEGELEERYTLLQLQSDTYLDQPWLDRLETLLLDKRQVVLYGPPGTGKTYVARKFARYFVDQSGGEVRVIQFHPSYSYEEFVEGIRPESDEGELRYPVKPGVFKRFCDAARRRPGSRYVLIVDEINRGSLPRVFGELLYLLEYREGTEPITLPYSGDRFAIPRNVFLIGTMNTADRSIALVDHALRRRFHFVRLVPDPEILRSWLEARGKEAMAWVADLLKEVNSRLEQDKVEWHLHIGHSHWMVRDGNLDEERAAMIWEHSVLPTLEEYFYKSADKLARYDYEKLKALVTSSE